MQGSGRIAVALLFLNLGCQPGPSEINEAYRPRVFKPVFSKTQPDQDCRLPQPWRFPAEPGCVNGDRRGREVTSLAYGAEGDQAVALLLAGAEAEGPIRSLRRRPQAELDPSTLNDLAVGLYLRAAREVDYADLVDALELTTESSEAGVLEARFNRALILESLGLRRVARESWSELVGDLPRNWAEEAQASLLALASPVRKESPQEARELAVRQTLPDWGAKYLSSRDSGHRVDAPVIAELASLRRPRDQTVAQLASMIDELRSQGRWSELSVLAEGLVEYGQALTHFTQTEYEVADPLLQSAEFRFTSIGSVMGLWSSLWRASILMYEGDYKTALRRCLKILESARLYHLPALEGRVEWLRAVIATRTADFGSAHSSYLAAKNHLELAEELEGSAALDYLIAENLDKLGVDSESVRLTFEAIHALQDLGELQWQHQALRFAGIRARRLGRPRASLALHEEGVLVAGEIGHPQYVAEALLWKGQAHLELGRLRDATDCLIRAERLAQEIGGRSMRSRIQADIEWGRGKLEIERNSRKATKHLTTALEYFRELDFQGVTPEILVDRARAFLREGDREAAESDLQDATDLFFEQRVSLLDLGHRASFANTTSTYFDELVALLVNEERIEESFATAERSRHILFQLGGAGSRLAPTATLSELASELDSGTGLLAMATTAEEALFWMIRGTELEFARADLPQLLGALGELLEEDNSESSELEALLGEHILGAFRATLEKIDRLVVVPDRELVEVPFAALEVGAGSPLVESVSIAIAPSATYWARSPAPSALSARDAILVVGGVDHSEGPSADLPFLPGTLAEAATVASVYSNKEVLTGRVTRSAVETGLEVATVFHFAGHAIHHQEDPLRSSLVLAPSQADLGLLESSAIRDLSLSHLQVVVLAACQGADAPRARGGGSGSLAGSFLLAGVPGVIASTRPLPDKTFVSLMSRLHEEMVRGVHPASALQRAQRVAIQEGQPSTEWSALQYIGR